MKFRDKLAQKQFTLTLEVDPPKGTGIKKTMARLAPLVPYLDAINVAACPVAQLRMDALAFATLMNREYDIEVIIHLTMRDFSLLGLQSYLLGASALGYHNILAMTGDAAKHSDVEGTKGVFQANSQVLLRLMRTMNKGFSSSGKKMNKKTKFFPGATANPSAVNLVNEVKKMNKKIEAGAEFFQTQPMFRSKTVEVFREYARELPKPILMGTMLLKNYDSSLWLNAKVPGLFVPAEVLDRMKRKDNQDEGISVAKDFVQETLSSLDGLHLFPMNNYEAMLELVQDIRKMTPA